MSSPLSQDPVFITGYPRSGTTLLLGLLLSQGRFRSFPETHYFCVVERGLLDEQGCIPADRLDEALARIAAKTGARFSEADRQGLRTRALTGGLESKALFELLVGHLLRERSQPGNDASCRWIEKTPVHANFLPRILGCYPTMQAVHVLRHPVPAIFSRKWKFPFNRDTPLAQLARRWNELQANVRRFGAAHPQKIRTLRYEDLVGDPAGQMDALGRFLGFPYDPAAAAGYRDHLAEAILSSETWKREDLGKAWGNTNHGYRERIDPEQAAEIEAITGDTMRGLGYAPFFAR